VICRHITVPVDLLAWDVQQSLGGYVCWTGWIGLHLPSRTRIWPDQLLILAGVAMGTNVKVHSGRCESHRANAKVRDEGILISAEV
jgi:hypothetical protein